MVEWNYAAIVESVAREVPDRVAIVSDGRTETFAQLDERMQSIGKALTASGVAVGDKVAVNMLNRPEHLESFLGIQSCGAVPVNVNYRYSVQELTYLFENSDAVGVITESQFLPEILKAREALGRELLVVAVDTRSREGAYGYEDFCEYGRTLKDGDRHQPNGEDLIFLYTGGTTGYPKAVMWRSEDLYISQWQLNRPGKPLVDPAESARAGKKAATTLPASPLMHGTGFFAAMAALTGGGTVVLIPTLKLDPVRIWREISLYSVSIVTIVGDVFARPLLEAIEADSSLIPESLAILSSSGARFSPQLKARFLELIPNLRIIDSLGATEAMITRSTVTSDGQKEDLGAFTLSERVVVLDDEDQPVTPGSSTVGRLAVTGLLPIGYYKDPEKSAATWPVINGRRYSISGDMATVDKDGRINFVGRGNACVNTGGEKVYPDEVETVLKEHPDITDAAVVGVPDERWGEAVTALVATRLGSAIDYDEVRSHVKGRLAAYKAPKHVFVVPDVTRTASGKVDYRAMKSAALARMVQQ